MYIAAFVMVLKRNELQKSNLFDTYAGSTGQEEGMIVCNATEHLYARSADGRCNDLGSPRMGMYLRRFGRNVPVEETFVNNELLLKPSPREVANKLLNRTSFVSAPVLNLISAAWVQFMFHD